MNYTTKTIIKEVAKQLDYTQKDVTEVVNTFIGIIKSTLVSGGEVAITDFGKLKTAIRAGRMIKNPQTGEPLEIPEKRVVKFSPGKAIKEAVANA